MKRYMNGTDMFITEYHSISEFLNDINSLPNNKFFKDRHSSQRTEANGGDWYMTPDYARATYLLSTGWDAAAEKMQKKVKMTAAVGSQVRTTRPTYGVVGSQASVPRYLQGIPTNMVSRQITHTKNKVVTITKGITYSCMWTPEAILRESIKALQIIQSMENAGQRVRLNVMFCVSHNEKHSMCKVCVKQPDERLNISKVSFPLAHPSMLRRFFLKWVEVDPFTPFDLGEGYGHCSPLLIKERGMAENEYYIPEQINNMDELIHRLQNGKPRGEVKSKKGAPPKLV